MSGYKHTSDEELVSLLRASDHAAFNEIYHRYFAPIYIHVNKKLQDEEQAKDVVQEIFASLWFKRNDLKIKNLASYLFGAARNKVFDIYAHEKVQQKHLGSLQTYLTERILYSTDHQVREAQFKAYIDKQIEALPPKMRRIFEMSRKEQLTHKEIAQQLNTTENNVSKQVNNALKILRTKLSIVLFFVL